jgi:hypothetical protein
MGDRTHVTPCPGGAEEWPAARAPWSCIRRTSHSRRRSAHVKRPFDLFISRAREREAGQRVWVGRQHFAGSGVLCLMHRAARNCPALHSRDCARLWTLLTSFTSINRRLVEQRCAATPFDQRRSVVRSITAAHGFSWCGALALLLPSSLSRFSLACMAHLGAKHSSSRGN